MALFANDLGVDLGTSNVVIYSDKLGIVVREPSVVAIDKNTGRLLQVGTEAKNMLGRTPGNVAAMYPLKGGVISDHVMTVKLLQTAFRKAAKRSIFKPKPRVVICVPSGVTEVEERTVINAAIEAGARRVYLIEEPLAAGVGANLDMREPNGHMVVNIGGGTTDVAVLSMNSVAVSNSIKVAGDSFDEAIARYMRREHDMVIGKTTAEDMKIQIGTVNKKNDGLTYTVRGRDLKSGMPKELTLRSSDLAPVLQRTARAISDEVVNVLEDTSPELVSDIAVNGITLTGGGSQMDGLAAMIEQRTGIRCKLADDPDSCVAYGCGRTIAWIRHMKMKEGPINIAKKRAMRS